MTSREPIAVRTEAVLVPHRRFRPWKRGDAVGVFRLPAGFLGMLALVILVEAGVTRAGARFVDPIDYCWAFSARAARVEGPKADVLFFGDSLTKHGLSARVVADVTGKKAYNLASSASPVSLTYFNARRALDAGSKPSAIVFDMKPSLMVGGPEFAVRPFSVVLTPLEILDLARSRGSLTIAAQMAVGSILPTHRARHLIREAVWAALHGESTLTGRMNAVADRQWTVNLGANLATPRPGYLGVITEAEHLSMISRGFHAERVNDEYARRFLALTTSRKVPTYLLLAPFVPALIERRAKTGAEEKYVRYVRSLQDRYPALTVLDAREAGYPVSVFIDPIHLDFRGALALSSDVGEVLRHDFERPAGTSPEPKRWVRLPSYRVRDRPADLEDVETSRARIGVTTEVK